MREIALRTATRFRLIRLAAVGTGSFALLFIAAAVHDDQSEVFSNLSYSAYIFRQVFFESIAQPFYLAVSLLPPLVAAVVIDDSHRVATGTLLLLSTLLPNAAFEYVRISNGELVGYHTSLHQLASPQHDMPAILPGFLLVMAGGVTALVWRAAPGAYLGAVGLVAVAIGWTFTEADGPFVIDDRALVTFPTSKLLFGYYIGWLGAAAGFAGVFFGKWRNRRVP